MSLKRSWTHSLLAGEIPIIGIIGNLAVAVEQILRRFREGAGLLAKQVRSQQRFMRHP